MSKPGYKSISVPDDVHEGLQAIVVAYEQKHGATLSMAQILRVIIKFYEGANSLVEGRPDRPTANPPAKIPRSF